MQLMVLLMSLKTKEAPDISSVEKYFVNTDSVIWGGCIGTAESDFAELPRTSANDKIFSNKTYKEADFPPTLSR